MTKRQKEDLFIDWDLYEPHNRPNYGVYGNTREQFFFEPI